MKNKIKGVLFSFSSVWGFLHIIAADLDSDNNIDLAVVNNDDDDLSIFLVHPGFLYLIRKKETKKLNERTYTVGSSRTWCVDEAI